MLGLFKCKKMARRARFRSLSRPTDRKLAVTWQSLRLLIKKLHKTVYVSINCEPLESMTWPFCVCGLHGFTATLSWAHGTFQLPYHDVVRCSSIRCFNDRAHGFFSVPVFAAKLLGRNQHTMAAYVSSGENKQCRWMAQSIGCVTDFEFRNDDGERWWKRAARKRRHSRSHAAQTLWHQSLRFFSSTACTRPRAHAYEFSSVVVVVVVAARRWPMSYRDFDSFRARRA